MEAYDNCHEALKIRYELLSVDHVSFSDTYFGLAKVFLDIRDNDNSIEFFNKALELQKRYLDSKHYQVCRTLSYLATAYSHDGQLILAKSIFEEVLCIQQAAYPRAHPDIGITLHHMASNCWRLNLIDQAIVFYRKSLEINEQFYPSGHIERKSVERKLQVLLSDYYSDQRSNLIDCYSILFKIIFVLIMVCLFPCPPAFTSDV